MPVHDVGYRGWHGRKRTALTRWQIITKTGIGTALKSRWVARMLFLAWLPVVYWGIGFFIMESTLAKQTGGATPIAETIVALPAVRDSAQTLGISKQNLEGGARVFDKRLGEFASDDDQQAERARKKIADVIESQFKAIPQSRAIAAAIRSGDESSTRNVLWSWLLMTFFRYPQGMLILFLIGSIAPSLISRDLRSRAFLLYFSRPIGKLEYMAGKLLVPAIFTGMVTLVPAIVLYFFAIMMSPDLSVFWSTWDIPLRIGGATLVLVTPVAAISVMLSSLTHESRFANFAWFAVWAVGHGAWVAILASVAFTLRASPFDSIVMEHPVSQRWSVLSLYNNLGAVQSWVFGFAEFTAIWPSAAVLAGATVVSLIVLHNRISAPVRL